MTCVALDFLPISGEIFIDISVHDVCGPKYIALVHVFPHTLFPLVLRMKWDFDICVRSSVASYHSCQY